MVSLESKTSLKFLYDSISDGYGISKNKLQEKLDNDNMNKSIYNKKSNEPKEEKNDKNIKKKIIIKNKKPTKNKIKKKIIIKKNKKKPVIKKKTLKKSNILKKPMVKKKPLNKVTIKKKPLKKRIIKKNPLKKRVIKNNPLKKRVIKNNPLKKKVIKKKPLKKVTIKKKPLKKKVIKKNRLKKKVIKKNPLKKGTLKKGSPKKVVNKGTVQTKKRKVVKKSRKRKRAESEKTNAIPEKSDIPEPKKKKVKLNPKEEKEKFEEMKEDYKKLEESKDPNQSNIFEDIFEANNIIIKNQVYDAETIEEIEISMKVFKALFNKNKTFQIIDKEKYNEEKAQERYKKFSPFHNKTKSNDTPKTEKGKKGRPRKTDSHYIKNRAAIMEKFDMYQQVVYMNTIYPLWTKEMAKTVGIDIVKSNIQPIVQNLIESTRFSIITIFMEILKSFYKKYKEKMESINNKNSKKKPVKTKQESSKKIYQVDNGKIAGNIVAIIHKIYSKEQKENIKVVDLKIFNSKKSGIDPSTSIKICNFSEGKCTKRNFNILQFEFSNNEKVNFIGKNIYTNLIKAFHSIKIFYSQLRRHITDWRRLVEGDISQPKNIKEAGEIIKKFMETPIEKAKIFTFNTKNKDRFKTVSEFLFDQFNQNCTYIVDYIKKLNTSKLTPFWDLIIDVASEQMKILKEKYNKLSSSNNGEEKEKVKVEKENNTSIKEEKMKIV